MRMISLLALGACSSSPAADPVPADSRSPDGGPFQLGGVRVAVDGDHGPPQRDKDDAAPLRVLLDDTPWIGINAKLDARGWNSALVPGPHRLSVRTSAQPDREVTQATWTASPVVVNDPDLGPAFETPDLLAYWLPITGVGSDLAMSVHQLDYDPPASEHWRLYFVNGRSDSAITLELVEAADDGQILPGGQSTPLFTVPANGRIDGREVPWPRYRTNLVFHLDAYPDAPISYINLAAPNWLHIGTTSTIPNPDGTILYVGTLSEDPAAPTELSGHATTRVFACRDARYKPLVLERDGDCKEGSGFGMARAAPRAAPFTGIDVRSRPR